MLYTITTSRNGVPSTSFGTTDAVSAVLHLAETLTDLGVDRTHGAAMTNRALDKNEGFTVFSKDLTESVELTLTP